MVKVKVLHYDHRDLNPEESKIIRKLQERIGEDSGIEYQYFGYDLNSRTPEENKISFEDLLSEQDVLLVHPGAESCPEVLLKYPKRFPNLKIGIVSFHLADYESEDSEGIEFLDYENLGGIIDFILTPKNKEVESDSLQRSHSSRSHYSGR